MLFYLRTITSLGQIYIPGSYSKPSSTLGYLEAIFNVPIFSEDVGVEAVQTVAVVQHTDGSHERYDLDDLEEFDEPLVIPAGRIQYFTRHIPLAAVRDLDPNFDTADVLQPAQPAQPQPH